MAKSTYDTINAVAKKAYLNNEAAGGDPDLLTGHRKQPKLTHYSWRRHAAEVAQDMLARDETNAQEVDLHFGWNLAKYKKKMSLHYSSRGRRTARAKLSKFI